MHFILPSAMPVGHPRLPPPLRASSQPSSAICHPSFTMLLPAAAKSQEDGRSRGFAHVQFDSVEAAAKAIAMSGTDLLGRELFIDSAEERSGGRPAGGAGRPAFGSTPGRGGGRGGESSPESGPSRIQDTCRRWDASADSQLTCAHQSYSFAAPDVLQNCGSCRARMSDCLLQAVL